MLTLKLYKYSGKNNVVSKALDEQTAHTENGVIFEDFDLITPSIKVRTKTEFADILAYNYALLDGKYYFVENAVILSTDVYRLNLRLDVLTTYQTEIKAATATAINKTNSNPYISNRQNIYDLRPIVTKLDFSENTPFSVSGSIIMVTLKGNV